MNASEFTDKIELHDVWHSADGINWSQAPDAPWAIRKGHAALVHDGKMWVTGGTWGMAPWAPGGEYNDVWYSENGTSWQQATGAASWRPRASHTMASFLGKMWVLGGRGEHGLEDTVSAEVFCTGLEAPPLARAGNFWSQLQ